MDIRSSYFGVKIRQMYDLLKNLDDENFELTFKKIIFDLKSADEEQQNDSIDYTYSSISLYLILTVVIMRSLIRLFSCQNH